MDVKKGIRNEKRKAEGNVEPLKKRKNSDYVCNKGSHCASVPNLQFQKRSDANQKYGRSKNDELILAAGEGKATLVVKLIKEGANINFSDTHKSTALHHTTERGLVKVVKTLIRHGASLNLKNANGETPLHLAACKNYEIFKTLVDEGALVNEVNCSGETALHIAVSNNRCITVEKLCNHGAIVGIQNNEGDTALHLAIRHDADVFIINLLLDNGASFSVHNLMLKTPLNLLLDKNVLSPEFATVIEKLLLEKNSNYALLQNSNGNTLLHLVSKFGFFKFVKILLEEGASIDSQNLNGTTPLLIALYNKHETIAETLILEGANVNIRNNKKDMPLHIAITKTKNTEYKICLLLLEKGAHVNFGDRNNNSPLHLSLMEEAEVVVDQILKKSSVKLNLQNKDGETPLHICAKKNLLSVAEILMQKKANLNLKDKDGNTPLHIAVTKGFSTFVEKLIQSKSNVNEKNKNGDTALHIVLSVDSSDDVASIAKLLVENGASGNLQNSKSLTPVTLLIDKVDDIYSSFFYRNSSAQVVVEKLLQDKKSKYALVQNSSRNTLLHVACIYGYLTAVNVLLDQGALINARNSNGDTPLMMALKRVHDKVAETLIQRGANVNNANLKNDTPLTLSIAHGGNSEKTVSHLLLSKGAYVNVCDSEGNNALHHSVMKGVKSLVEVVLNKSVNFDVQNANGDTPLHLCAKGRCKDHPSITELLLKKKINVNIRNKYGSTPLHFFAGGGSVEFAKKVVELGADIDAQNKDGETPLHRAALGMAAAPGKLVLIKNLIEAGAAIDIRNKKNKTPYQVTCNERVKCMLLSHHLKLKGANMKVSGSVEPCYCNQHQCTGRFETKCLEELERIKNTELNDGSRLSIVFTQHENPYYLSSEERCKNLEETLQSPMLLQEFPLYWHILRNTFQRMKQRFVLLRGAIQSLDVLYSQSMTCTRNLPYLVMQEVMDYLSNKDLQNLINTTTNIKKGSNGASVALFY